MVDRTAGTAIGPRSPRVRCRPRELARATVRSRLLVRRPPRAVARPRRGVLDLRCDRHPVLRTARHVRLRDLRPHSDRPHLRDRRPRRPRDPANRVRLPLVRDRLLPVRRRLSRPRLLAVNPVQVSKHPAGPMMVRRRTVSHRSGRHRPVKPHGRQPRSLRRRPTRPCALRRCPPSRRLPVKHLVSPLGFRRPVRQPLRRCRPSRATLHTVAPERRPGSAESVSVPHRKERTTGSSRRTSRRPTCPDAVPHCRRTQSSIGPHVRQPSRSSANRPRTRPNGEKPPGRKRRSSTGRHGTSNARI